VMALAILTPMLLGALALEALLLVSAVPDK
jgi:hypothetical protein